MNTILGSSSCRTTSLSFLLIQIRGTYSLVLIDNGFSFFQIMQIGQREITRKIVKLN